jgi:hypothetical protein
MKQPRGEAVVSSDALDSVALDEKEAPRSGRIALLLSPGCGTFSSDLWR